MEKIIDEMITKYQSIEDNYEANPNLDCHERGVEAGKADLSWRVVEDLEQLKSSLPKPVEVPEVKQCVADWYEDNKKELDNKIWLYCNEWGRHDRRDPFYQWFNDTKNNPIETLIRMKDGYTVVKEPLYYMPVPYLDETYYVINESGMDVAYGIGDKFLVSELDKYFPDIKKLAAPVEEDAE